MARKIFLLLLGVLFALIYFPSSISAAVDCSKVTTPTAGCVGIGPIEVDQQDPIDYPTSILTFSVTVQTFDTSNNPLESPLTFENKVPDGCPTRAKSGPCIPKIFLPSSSNGNTKIKIISRKMYVNGNLDTTSPDPLSLTQGAELYIKADEGETGWITYNYSTTFPPFGVPVITFTPSQNIPINTDVQTYITVPPPQAIKYTIAFDNFPTCALIVSCDKSQNCSISPPPPQPPDEQCPNFFKNWSYSRGAISLQIDGSTLADGSTYTLEVGSGSIYIKNSFNVGSPSQNGITLALSPNSIPLTTIPKGGSVTINVTIGNATSDKYNISVVGAPVLSGFVCNPNDQLECATKISIPSTLFSGAGNYRVHVENASKTSIYADANLSVSNSSGTGGTGQTTCDPTKDKSCSSAAGITCDPNNPGTPDKPNPGNGIYTAVGCVPTDLNVLIPDILKVALFTGGGIALLLMIFAAIGMIMSNGSPEALKAAQGRFLAAVIGLVFIIFAVLLLKIVGQDILNLPGFSSSATVTNSGSS